MINAFKKCISVFCVIVFVLSLSATAFADSTSKVVAFIVTSSTTVKVKYNNIQEVDKNKLHNKYKAASNGSSVSVLSLADPYEPNNDVSTATVMPSDTIYANIGYDGDWDFYSKVFSQGQDIAISLKNIPSGCDYDLYFCDSNGTILATSDNSGNVNELIQGTINVTGAYIIAVSPYTGYNDNQNYTLYAGDAVKTGTGFYQSPWLPKLQLNNAGVYSAIDTLDLTYNYSIPSNAVVKSMYLNGSYTGNFGGKSLLTYATQTNSWYTANLSDIVAGAVGKNVRQVWKYKWRVSAIYQPIVSWTPQITINYQYTYIPY